MYFTNAANKRGRKTTLNFPKGHIAKQSKSRSRSEMPKLLSGRKKKTKPTKKERSWITAICSLYNTWAIRKLR